LEIKVLDIGARRNRKFERVMSYAAEEQNLGEGFSVRRMRFCIKISRFAGRNCTATNRGFFKRRLKL